MVFTGGHANGLVIRIVIIYLGWSTASRGGRRTETPNTLVKSIAGQPTDRPTEYTINIYISKSTIIEISIGIVCQLRIPVYQCASIDMLVCVCLLDLLRNPIHKDTFSAIILFKRKINWFIILFLKHSFIQKCKIQHISVDYFAEENI